MSRRKTRELAMKLFYQMEIMKEFDEEIIKFYMEENNISDEYIVTISKNFIENKDKIDEIIEKYSKNWKISRMGKIEASLLRLATTEILFMEDIPKKVSVNEVLELSKTYGDEKSVPFLNGILGRIVDEK